MRLSILVFLIIFNFPSFGQDTILLNQDTVSKILLKPISKMTFEKMLSREQIEIQDRKEADSINNSEYCKMKRQEFLDSCLRQYYKELTDIEPLVKELNARNTGYYYYIYNTCDFITFYECEGCSGLQEKFLCWHFDIVKIEKSRIILDGPSGEVFYYEDLRRMP